MKTAPTLIFEGGQLSILARGFGEKDGSGKLIVKETDLEFDGEGYCTLPIARTELIAIRDHIGKHLGETKIKLNGKELTVYGEEVSFLDIQKMSGEHVNTITYRWKGDGDHLREGILAPNDKPVKIADGMVFNAVYIR